MRIAQPVPDKRRYLLQLVSGYRFFIFNQSQKAMSDVHPISIRPADLHALGTPIVPETLAGVNAHGIQETLELIDFLFLAPEKLIGALKDGVQLGDVTVFIDREILASARTAFSGSRHIAGEVADLTLDEYEVLTDHIKLRVFELIRTLRAQA